MMMNGRSALIFDKRLRSDDGALYWQFYGRKDLRKYVKIPQSLNVNK